MCNALKPTSQCYLLLARRTRNRQLTHSKALQFSVRQLFIYVLALIVFSVDTQDYSRFYVLLALLCAVVLHPNPPLFVYSVGAPAPIAKQFAMGAPKQACSQTADLSVYSDTERGSAPSHWL